VKDFEPPKTDPSQDAPQRVARRGPSHSEGRDASPAGAEIVSPSQPEADVLNTPELSHPANAAPRADLLGHLQQSHGNTYVQRVVREMSAAKSGAPSYPSGSGQALDAGVKTEMESAFGENLGDVRVHADISGERMNEELGARAVTRGRDVYFGRGEYNPSTRDGRELLAHELTHVIQQGTGAANQQADMVGREGDEFEKEAERAANAVLSGQPTAIVNRSAAPSLQRQPAQQPAQPPAPVVPTSSGLIIVQVNRLVRGSLPHGVKYDPLSSLADPYAEVLQFTVPPGGRALPLTGFKEFNDPGPPTRSRTVLLRVARLPGQVTQTEVAFTVGSHQFDVRFIFPPRP